MTTTTTKTQSLTRFVIRRREVIPGHGQSYLKTVVRPAHWNGWDERRYDATFNPRLARRFASEAKAKAIMERMGLTAGSHEIVAVVAGD